MERQHKLMAVLAGSLAATVLGAGFAIAQGSEEERSGEAPAPSGERHGGDGTPPEIAEMRAAPRAQPVSGVAPSGAAYSISRVQSSASESDATFCVEVATGAARSVGCLPNPNGRQAEFTRVILGEDLFVLTLAGDDVEAVEADVGGESDSVAMRRADFGPMSLFYRVSRNPAQSLTSAPGEGPPLPPAVEIEASDAAGNVLVRERRAPLPPESPSR